MKLGEALSLRARQAQQLNDLRKRILANTVLQEGDEPAEDLGVLVEEFEKMSRSHAELVERIARTNIASYLPNGDNLFSSLHIRETLRRNRNLHDAMTNATTAISSGVGRYMRSELRYVSHVDVPKEHEKISELDEAIRRLDSKIQEANWKTDLV